MADKAIKFKCPCCESTLVMTRDKDNPNEVQISALDTGSGIKKGSAIDFLWDDDPVQEPEESDAE